MNKCNCHDCLFGDTCPAEQACEYFSPLEDNRLAEYIENKRQEFYRDWARYTSDCND